MRLTGVIILAVLVALLGFYVYWFEIRPGGPPASTEADRLVFPTLAHDAANLADKISALRIERGSETLEFVHGDDAWRITLPVDAPASGSQLDSLVEDLLGLAREEKAVSEPDDLAQFGLDKPTVKVQFVLEGRNYELDFGVVAPGDRHVYARVPESPDVFRVAKWDFERFNKSVADFREKRMLTIVPGQLRRIDLISARNGITLEYRDPDWFVTSPVWDRADALKASDLVRRLSELEAVQFLEVPTTKLSDYGLAPAVAEVVLTSHAPVVVPVATTAGTETPAEPAPAPTGKVRKLLLGKVVPSRPDLIYAKVDDEGSVFTVNNEIVSRVVVEPRFYRDRLLARFSPAAVERVEITGPAGEITIQKQDRDWTITKPQELKADPATVDKLLEALASLEILRFVSDNPADLSPAELTRFGLDEDSAVVISVGVLGKPTQVFRVGNFDPVEKDVLVRRDQDPNVLAVKESFLKLARQGFLDFRTRVVGEINRYDVRALTIALADKTTTVLAKTGDKWFLTKPVNAPAYETAVNSLLGDLDRLQAERFLPFSDAGKYNLGSPLITVTVETRKDESAPVFTQFLIGPELPEGGHVARLAGQDLLFIVRASLVNHLKTEFHERLLWDFKEDDIKTISWTKGSQAVVIRREDDRWKLIRPDGAMLDTHRAEVLVNQLRYLSVDRFLSYSTEDASKFGLDKPVVTVVLTVADADYTLQVARPGKDGRAAARVLDKPGVFSLDAERVRSLSEGILVTPSATPRPGR